MEQGRNQGGARTRMRHEEKTAQATNQDGVEECRTASVGCLNCQQVLQAKGKGSQGI